jgi:PhzF family phenazine biosynthesis protein
MASLSYVTTDVFTNEKYAGNQLAIVQIPSNGLTQDEKQMIAKEFNYSETTFVHPRKDESSNDWTVDIFTLDQELPFAGHPTYVKFVGHDGVACMRLDDIESTLTSRLRDRIKRYIIKAQNTPGSNFLESRSRLTHNL